MVQPLHRKDRWLIWLVLLGSILLSFALFGNGIKGDFVFDDTLVIVGNPLVGHGIPDVVTIFTSPYHFHQPRTGLYRPLTIFSFVLNWFVFGSSPVSFHVTNILLHAVTVWLLFLFLRKLTTDKAAIIACLLFLVLPIHVEDVTSIVGRAEILALLFGLASLIALQNQSRWWAGIIFLLGLLSKETSIAFLPLAVYLLWFFYGKNIREVFRMILPMIGSLFLYFGFRLFVLGRYMFQNDATLVMNPIKYASWFSGIWTACEVFFEYLYQSIIPTFYSPDYSYNQIPVVSNLFSSPGAWLGMGGLALLIVVAWYKRKSVWGMGVALLILPYFIISNLVLKIGTIMADRLFYAPSAGLVLLLALVLTVLDRRIYKWTSFVVMVIIFTLFGGISIGRNKIWANETSLFEHAYAVAPASVVNKVNKSYLYLRAGEYAEAKTLIDQVLQQTPDHLPALNLAGQIYKKLKMFNRAEEFWKKTIALRSDYLNGYLNLGVLYYENGYLASAERVLTQAVAVYPRSSEVFVLGLSKIGLGKFDEAIDLMQRYPVAPADERRRSLVLGIAYAKKGDLPQARTYLWDIRNQNITYEEFLKRIIQGTVFDLGDI